MNVFKSIYSRLSFGGVAIVVLVSSCSSSGTGIDRKDPPVGGTPAEFGFQYAQTIAKNGNCDQALPILICLGEQGPGWELAVHSAGVCALEAAKLWTGPLEARPGFFGRRSKISFDKPYYQSKTALYDKGLSLLHASATAGWPDSQAVLARELSQTSTPATDLAEARLWLNRYDRNSRRKIYGTNTLDVILREKLANADLPAESDSLWKRHDLVKHPSRDPFCRQLISTGRRGVGPNAHPPEATSNSDLPEPETVDAPPRRAPSDH